jgi:hypothetical protein
MATSASARLDLRRRPVLAGHALLFRHCQHTHRPDQAAHQVFARFELRYGGRDRARCGRSDPAASNTGAVNHLDHVPVEIDRQQHRLVGCGHARHDFASPRSAVVSEVADVTAIRALDARVP